MYLDVEGNIGKLYGTIWEGDGVYISNELRRFFKGKTEATLHIHTPGGSVFDGNIIINAIREAKLKVTIIIDGVAASMGSVILAAAHNVKIAQNAYIMIHAPRGYINGTSAEMTKGAKLLASIEKIFIREYVTKTGKAESEVKEWLIGDNWFDANEALEAGLVDEIVGVEIEDIDFSAMQNMKVAAMMNDFEEKYIKHEPTTVVPEGNEDKSKSNNTNNNSMKLNAKSREILGLPEDASEEQINAAVAKLEKVQKENTTLKAEATKHKEAQVRALIEPALADGRILAKDKEQWEELATTNFELAKASIEKLPKKETLPTGSGKGNPSATDERADWSFTDWSRKDTKGLIAMKENEPDKYRELCEKSGVNY